MKTRRLCVFVFIVSSIIVFLALRVEPTASARASDAANFSTSKIDRQTLFTHRSQSVDLSYTADITFTPAFTTHLPLISNFIPRPPAGIYGQITYEGIPIGGIELKLNRCFRVGTDTDWSCFGAYAQYTSTLADGSYQFPAASSLGAEQKYYVKWYNGYNSSGNPNYVSEWHGPDILTYTAGQIVRGGSFDIANTLLLSPTNATTVGLPAIFRWARRAATPSDSYRVLLMGTTDASYWQSPLLGYVESYTLTNLPSNFTAGTRYAWLIEINTSDGMGFSHEGRTITFSSLNYSQIPALK